MKTEQPIKCPYCGHVWHRDFTDADAYHTQVEECSKCRAEFAVRLAVRYDLQVLTFAAEPVQSPALTKAQLDAAFWQQAAAEWRRIAEQLAAERDA